MHRRRGVGVSALKKKRETDERYANLAEKLEATEDAHVREFVDSFRNALESFAKKHKKKIRNDPTFRTRFAAMCAEIGVDPLQSSKGVWSELMGVGDFYYELGVHLF
uniref:Vacuolar-sorting protein SNF8 n=1 Tax=Aureoumbra lagunensis TaxID=44058 RepID=A0A6S8DA56_9STRA|mmetsp:Transcript_20496/g.31299  ORF Transcript_20496/g.31299 Transcript_20496/m.31299 type:complete len:107 (+) Transcript_20496:14-334(+)